AMIAAQKRMAEEFPYVAIEVPPGRPQIRHHPEADQWVPRGGVVRCLVRCDEYGRTIVVVDDRDLSMGEFSRMISTFEGWGMRIEFTPKDATERRPRLEVRDPDGR
ncbi:MAG: hypothetical protein AB7I30_03280, partial [Isosphaeraceae bacterium]